MLQATEPVLLILTEPIEKCQLNDCLMAETCSTRGPGKMDIAPLDLASSEGTLALAADRHPDGSGTGESQQSSPFNGLRN